MEVITAVMWVLQMLMKVYIALKCELNFLKLTLIVKMSVSDC